MVAIVCASLPVYKPLWQAFGRLATRFFNVYNSMSNSSILPSFVRRTKAKNISSENPQANKPFGSLRGVPVSNFGPLGGSMDSENPRGASVVSTIAEERDMVGHDQSFEI